MNHSARFIGIDVGGTAVKWSIVEGGTIMAQGSAATPRGTGTALVDHVVDLVQAATPDVGGVGMALPGLIDSVRRRVLVTPNLATEPPLVADVERRCGIPVSLLNDAHAFAYGEHRTGAGRLEPDVLFLTLGTGVGGMIALDGRILDKPTTTLGSIGHHVVDPAGELCPCGGRGCLETVASASAVVGQVTRAVLTSQSRTLVRLTGGDPAALTAQVVARAADAGDPWALDAFRRVGRFIGVAAASVCVLLQLPTVVIGGGMSAALGHITPVLDEILQQRASLTGPITVRPALLGPGAGSVGAALFAADHHPAVRGSTHHRPRSTLR